MNTNIYERTSLGCTELEANSGLLSRDAKRVLAMVNGKRSIEAIEDTLLGINDFSSIVESLLKRALIAIAPPPKLTDNTPPPDDEASSAKPSLDDIRLGLIR